MHVRTIMAIDEYNNLKEYIIREVGKEPDCQNIVTRLKEIFRKEINSPRQSEQIRNVAHLLQVLEKRNELAEDNVVLLNTIAGAMRDGSELNARIFQYNQHSLNNTGASTASYYDCDHTKQSNAEPPSRSSPINEKKRLLIYETIANEIGSHWRDLARNLDIREGQIQTISTKHKETSERITEVLKLSERRSDPQRWFYQLCDALESARRKDLQRALREIVMMNV